MPNSRETILAKLRTQQSVNGDGMPPAWRSRRQFDDLEARFVDSLKKVYGEPFHADSLEAALIRLNDLLRELNARCIVANHELPLSEVNFKDRWPELDWHIVGQTPGDLRSFCASADVGLSSADAVLAETGSLIVTSGPGKSRLATLLPPVHIALVPLSRLTTDIFTFTAARQGQLPANMVFISGPSKTGDIEQTMSIGVHGPKRFIVILYED